jgi:carboxymethylenebutenolidase
MCTASWTAAASCRRPGATRSAAPPRPACCRAVAQLRGASGGAHRPAHQDQLQEYPSPQGYGTVRGYLASRPTPRASCRRPGGAREPRPESAYRRHRAPPGAGRLHRLRAGRAVPLGGYPGDEDKARALFAKLDQAKTRADFVAAAGALKDCRRRRQGRRGRLLLRRRHRQLPGHRLPDLAAAVPFYGSQPPAAEWRRSARR